MSNDDPYIPSPPAARVYTDRTFRAQFPQRLAGLAGVLTALAEAGPAFTQSDFAEPTLHYIAQLADDLARECSMWATMSLAPEDQEGGAL